MATTEPRPTVDLEGHQKQYLDTRLGAGTWSVQGSDIHWKNKPVGSVSTSGDIELKKGLPRGKR